MHANIVECAECGQIMFKGHEFVVLERSPYLQDRSCCSMPCMIKTKINQKRAEDCLKCLR